MSRKYATDIAMAGMNDAEKAEYTAILRSPAATINDCMGWLHEHGYQISRGAVWKHRRNFQETLESVRQTAELTRAFVGVAREYGAESFGEANLTRLQQVIGEKLMRINLDDEIDSKELVQLSMAMNSAANAKQRIEAVKADMAKRQVEAVKQAEQAVKAGSSGQAVVDTVKRILGITE